MRPVERIDPFLDKVKIRYLIKHIWKLKGIGDPNLIKESIENDLDKIKEFWKDSPDLRFSQVLVNLGVIPNFPGFWYYWEEAEILEKQGYSPAECYYWGNNYDKDMKLLPRTIWKPIKELTTDHLYAIVDGGFVDRNSKYKKIMKDELKKRRDENKN